MKIRVRLMAIFTSRGWVVEVKTRREHTDPPDLWHTAWSTEPYHSENEAKARARRWVNENLPDSVT